SPGDAGFLLPQGTKIRPGAPGASAVCRGSDSRDGFNWAAAPVSATDEEPSHGHGESCEEVRQEGDEEDRPYVGGQEDRAQGCCQASAGEEGCQEDGAQGCCQAQAGEEGRQEGRAQGCRQAQARQEGCEEDGPQVGCQAQARQEGCEEDGPQVGRQAQARQEGRGQAPSGQEGCQEDREEDRAQGGQASCQEEGGQEGPTSCEAQGCPRGNALRSRTDDVIKTPKAVNHVPSSQPRRRGNFFA